MHWNDLQPEEKNMTEKIEDYYKFLFSDTNTMIVFEDFLDKFAQDGSLEFINLRFPIQPELLIERYFDENPIEKREVLAAKRPYQDLLKRLEEYIMNISSDEGTFYITDDYFFFPSKDSTDSMHLEVLANLLIKAKHRKIIVILNNQKNVNTSMVAKLKEILVKEEIEFSFVINDNFHDRYWLSDRNGGFALGTSINGLAKRTCIIQRLDNIDYAIILDEILEVSL